MKSSRHQTVSVNFDLEQRKGRLLEHLSGSAKTYLDLAEKLAAAAPNSDEYATLEGMLYARINQLRL